MMFFDHEIQLVNSNYHYMRPFPTEVTLFKVNSMRTHQSVDCLLKLTDILNFQLFGLSLT